MIKEFGKAKEGDIKAMDYIAFLELSKGGTVDKSERNQVWKHCIKK